MLKNISKLGAALNKAEQQSINGGKAQVQDQSCGDWCAENACTTEGYRECIAYCNS